MNVFSDTQSDILKLKALDVLERLRADGWGVRLELPAGGGEGDGGGVRYAVFLHRGTEQAMTSGATLLEVAERAKKETTP